MATLKELMKGVENLSENENEKLIEDFDEEYSSIESLESIIEMVENDSLNNDELSVLTESIEDIFNTILNEANQPGDCDEDEAECDVCGDCTAEEELDSHDGMCGTCWNNREEGLDEAMLKKSTMAQKKAAKAYARSAKGKKAMKLAAKKRKKYATKISRCKGKGRTFSFKAMTCVKPKKRR